MGKIFTQGLLGLAPRRRRAGYTQETFSQALCIERARYAMWESGHVWPSAQWLPKMADLLGCSIDDLYEAEIREDIVTREARSNMEQECRNIYRNARRASGLTQERWAEVLGISPEAVRQYETGRILPSDEVVLAMAEVAGQHIIAYWHLINKSRVAGRILPEVRRRTLPEAVLSVMCRIDDFTRGGLEDLKRLAADGKISADEIMAYGEAIAQMREVIQAAYELEYAGGEP